MAENEFEKNVQREMDEFKLRPSEEVWTKIDARIRDNKRKRRILFFILFASIALMLGGYAIYNYGGNKTISQTADTSKIKVLPNDQREISNSKNEERNKEIIAIKPRTRVQDIERTHNIPIISREKQRRPQGKYVTSISKETSSAATEMQMLNRNKEDKNNDGKRNDLNLADEDVSLFNQRKITRDSNENHLVRPNDNHLTLNDTAATKLQEFNNTSSSQVINSKRNNKPHTGIAWGVNFSAGSSVITEDAFSFKSSYSADVQYSSTPGSSTGGGPLTYSRYPQSQNKPAFAFKAGIHARKNISKRSSLSAGLGYSYLTDKVRIGSNQAQAQSALSRFYYTGSPQQSYTDHFHFIELPVTYNWRVTNNADHFLSLNAGISPSYLLSTNALLYDTTFGGVYYHNNNQVTKAHFNFISGISYEFKIKSDLKVGVGPQFSFDVTKVFKSDLDKRKYFLYTGIDARIFFERKKK